MSYCYDVMRRVFDAQIAPHVPDEKVTLLFGFLIDEMHSANHTLNDGINKNGRVSGAAKALDDASKATP
jgi:hypothetical protein